MSSVGESASSIENSIQEHICSVDGININYAKTGRGDHIVLLLPPGLGSLWTYFKPQLEDLNKEKFTIIAWDPPGYGKSRPPDRTFPKNFLERDADWAFNLMKTLGYEKFSLIGWCQGGASALILAAKYSEYIRKVILISTPSFITEKEANRYRAVSSFDMWSKDKLKTFFDTFGEQKAKELWDRWLNSINFVVKEQGGDYCRKFLSRVKCPTLIVHGDKDILISIDHSDYLKIHLKNSSLEIFKSANHDLHISHSDRFNKLAEDFLTKDCTSKEH